MNAESKLEQAAILAILSDELEPYLSPSGDPCIDGLFDCANKLIEYWQSLTTPASNEVEESAKEFFDKNKRWIGGENFIDEEDFFKFTTISKPHTIEVCDDCPYNYHPCPEGCSKIKQVEEGQTQEPVGGVSEKEGWVIRYEFLRRTKNMQDAIFQLVDEIKLVNCPPPAPIKKIVKEDMICPETNKHCDDECCTVGSECNVSGSDKLSPAPIKTEGEDEGVFVNYSSLKQIVAEVAHEVRENGYGGHSITFSFASWWLRENKDKITNILGKNIFRPPSSPVGIDVEALAKEKALKSFPNGTYNDGYFNMMQEQRREGFEEGFIAAASLPQSSTEEEKNCRAILTELVYLKNLKDSSGKTEEYEQRQPLVWITAKKFLEKYQHGF